MIDIRLIANLDFILRMSIAVIGLTKYDKDNK